MNKRPPFARCPRCQFLYNDIPATSRRDNKTPICSACGLEEAIFDFEMHLKKEHEQKWLKNDKKT